MLPVRSKGTHHRGVKGGLEGSCESGEGVALVAIEVRFLDQAVETGLALEEEGACDVGKGRRSVRR